MFPSDQYHLLDFGDGRRLERFGPLVLDRPCPAAEGVARSEPAIWEQVDARFERTDDEQGQWICRRELPERWTINHGSMVLELKRTDFGHLGVFPEQADNWEWIESTLARSASKGGNSQQLRSAPTSCLNSPAPSLQPFTPSLALRASVLNLFAYTGGSTLAAAVAGAEVVHVDAAKNIVAWARRNAGLSGLAEAPIRWIAEDAMKFAKRELRRGNRYDAVILDPPSYGHGLHGEVWRVSTHLPRLLKLCGELTAGRRQFMLLTCHTPGFGPGRLRDMMIEALGESDTGTVTARQLTLRAATGRELPSGVVVHWTASNFRCNSK